MDDDQDDELENLISRVAAIAHALRGQAVSIDLLVQQCFGMRDAPEKYSEQSDEHWAIRRAAWRLAKPEAYRRSHRPLVAVTLDNSQLITAITYISQPSRPFFAVR